MRTRLRRFARARSGSALVAFALVLPVLVGAAAFGVDAGVFFLERRALQKAADAAALAAAADLDRADAVTRRMLLSNGQGDARYTLVLGRYAPDPAVPRDERFLRGGGAAANAVSIEATRSVPALFARIFGQETATIGVRSQAAMTPVVSFAIGSRLAAVDPPLVDALARTLLGAPLGLDVMDYRGLVRSRLPTGTLLRELALAGGLAPDVTVAEVLRRPILLSAFLSVAAAELDGAGDPSGASALRKAARHTVGARLEIEPGDLLGLDEPTQRLRLDYPGEALGAKVSVLQLLSAAVTDRSIGHAVSLRLGLPGLAGADLGLLLGEGERGARSAAVGRSGEEGGPSAETAQTRLRLRLRAETGAILAGVGAEVPVELVAAGARATVISAVCAADPAQREVRLAVEPGLLRLSLGASDAGLEDLRIGDAVRPAAIATSPVARVEAGGTVALKRLTPVVATFRGAEIGDGTVKTVRTRPLAESLVATLLGEVAIEVRLGPLGVGLPGPLVRSARTLLAGLLKPVDAVLGAALAVAGVGLGEADLRVDDLVCGPARLVG